MSDFEKWFRSLNANGKTVYFLGNEHKVSEMAWNHQQAIIENLKAQLNNIETCYIGIKKINDEQSAIIQGHFAARQDMQKRIDEYKKLTVSIRNEFDLWSDDSEFADVIEAQIENLEALRGEHV